MLLPLMMGPESVIFCACVQGLRCSDSRIRKIETTNRFNLNSFQVVLFSVRRQPPPQFKCDLNTQCSCGWMGVAQMLSID